MGPIAILTLFRLEWDLRATTVIGMVGAGAAGQALYDAEQLFHKPIIIYAFGTWVVVALPGAVSDSTRGRLGWTAVIPLLFDSESAFAAISRLSFYR
jgi:ABC-type phosphate/phosphonate transport system permease subunit